MVATMKIVPLWVLIPNALLVALLGFSAMASEVLVDTTSTKVTSSRPSRKSVVLQNKGPNSIFCDIRTAAVLNKSFEVHAGSWAAIPATGSTPINCISSALQSTGAATIILEF